jgi:hypothetical protein
MNQEDQSPEKLRLGFVTASHHAATLSRRLAASPCFEVDRYRLLAFFNPDSAAEAFNAAMQLMEGQVDWLVWVHHDVVLPAGWPQRFRRALGEAQRTYPDAAVAGVYGVQGRGEEARHAGHVLDRGELLHPPLPLPCPADALDELLVAVRVDSGLRMDPALRFDFYATDLVLQAGALQMKSVIVDACCEHWSDMPRHPPFSHGLIERIVGSAAHFESKWRHQLPVTTPCFDIRRSGDVNRWIQRLVTGANEPG